VRWRYALRANTAASAGGAASAWATATAPSARPAAAYAGPLRLGGFGERAVRAGGGQGGAPIGRVRLTPPMPRTPRSPIARAVSSAPVSKKKQQSYSSSPR